MANHNHRHLHILSKENKDTGFGTNAADSYGGRFLNKDGTMNMRRDGISIFKKISIFHRMLTMPLWRFITVILLFYFAINLAFAVIYIVIGVEQLEGIRSAGIWQNFKQVFYFSTQTFTTVGYGRVSPVGDAANVISSIEALTGFLSFAIATGLIYGRFARPRSYLVFSENALISPFGDKTALMFRLASYKDNHNLTDVDVLINLGMLVSENGNKPEYKFYRIELERSKIESLVMNWTIVHPIDEKSPLFGLTAEDMKNADVELYILIRGYDEVFSSAVQQRTSYIYSEILH
ncbi:MAG TPA: ion channel, partial [Bacteroidia bacterium]|nr:ion channel [Bacteroidia bacterium]